MKSFRATLVLGLIIAAMVGYAVFETKQDEKKTAAQAEKEKFVSFQTELVSSLQITRPQVALELKKEGEIWKMTKPVEDPVETETVRAFLGSIREEKGSEMPAAVGGAYNWAEYALSEPSSTIELKQADQSLLKLSISNRAAFDGSYYVRLGERLFLGNGGWAAISEKGVSHFRDKRFWRKPEPLKRLSFQVNAGEVKNQFALVSKEGGWGVEKGSELIDTKRVESFVDSLKSIRGLAVVADSADAAQLKNLKLDQPAVHLTLNQFEADIWIGKDESTYFKSNESGALIQLSKGDGDQFLATLGDFRDGRALFKMDIEQVKQVRVVSGSGALSFEKTDSHWNLKESKQNKKLNETELQKLFEKISNIEAKAFFPAQQKIGRATKSFEFLDAQGKILLKLELGDTFVPKAGRLRSQNLTYARLQNARETLALLTSEVVELPTEQLLETITTSPPDDPVKSEKK